MSFTSRNNRRIKQEPDTIEMFTHWKPIFDKYDLDRDGRIPLHEFKARLHQANNEIARDLPPSVINEMVERADWDKNSYITYDEFVRMIYAMEMGKLRPRFQKLLWLAAHAVVPTSERSATVRRYIEEYSCLPPPLFLTIITIIQVVIYIIYSVRYNEFSASGPVPVESALIYNPCLRKEAWRFLTYMFIHAGAVHLFFNVLIQLLLGIPLELVHKWWRLLLLYLAGVMAGSMAATVSDPDTLLAGASGGVYALIAAHLANVIINFKEMDFAWIRLTTLILFGTLDTGMALYMRYWLDRRSRTSYASHIGGALAGLLLGMVVLRNLHVHRWEVKLGWIALVLYFLLMGAGIMVNILVPSYFPSPNSDFCKLFL